MPPKKDTKARKNDPKDDKCIANIEEKEEIAEKCDSDPKNMKENLEDYVPENLVENVKNTETRNSLKKNKQKVEHDSEDLLVSTDPRVVIHGKNSKPKSKMCSGFKAPEKLIETSKKKVETASKGNINQENIIIVKNVNTSKKNSKLGNLRKNLQDN